MLRKTFIIIMIVLILLLSIPNTAAITTERKDVQIDPGDYIFEGLYAADKGDKIDVKVTSDIPINVYIITSEDYYGLNGHGFKNAKYSEENITSTQFTFKVPDDQSYYLIIENPNFSTATVDCEYTDILGTKVEEAVIGFFVICGIVIVVAIVVIIIIVYFVFFRKKEKPQYPYPPPGQSSYPPPQQPPVDQASHPCPTCKSALTLVPQYNKWYCERCGKYP